MYQRLPFLVTVLTAAFCFCVLVAGCGPTQQELMQQDIDAKRATLDGLVYDGATYDDILSKFGPPDRCENGDKVRVCEWARHGQPQTNIFFLRFGAIASRKQHGESVLMTFDRQTTKLIRYKYNRW